MKYLAKHNNLQLFLLILGVYCLMLLYLNMYVLNDGLYYNSYSHILSNARIEEMLTTQKKMDYFQYIYFFIYFLVKLLFTTFCLFVYGYFSEQFINWKTLFGIALVAELVFVIEMVIRVVYFSIHAPQTFSDLANFNFFSVAYFINSAKFPYLAYVVQTINLFEILYVLVIAKLLRPVTGNKTARNIGFVLKSYGLGMIFWVALVTFFLIQIT
jgi:hypothetical protein